MTYQLRDYQQKAVDFAVPRLKTSKKPLLMYCSMAFGKTWLVAEIAKQWGGKVLVLTTTKELCEQDYDKACIVAGEENVGIYSASLDRKETNKPIIVSTVQSASKHPELWADFGLLIGDEIDVMPIDGMFGKLYNSSQNKKVLGLTATPYATIGSRKGHWYTSKLWPMHKIKSKEFGWFWGSVEYVCSEKDLLDQGYLCPLKIYSSPINCHLLKMNSNGSEYSTESIDIWVKQIYNRIIEVMVGAENHGMCKSGIVFMPSVESCKVLENMCLEQGISARCIHCETPAKERAKIVEAHKSGELRWLINQGIATRGFDNPMVDCIVMSRPTMSLRLWRQAIGRGIRLAEGKKVCSVLDLTKNAINWGGLEDVEIKQTRVNGFPCDQILLRGQDIAGTEVSKIDLRNRKAKPKENE